MIKASKTYMRFQNFTSGIYMRFQNFTSGGKICPMYFVHALFIRFIQIYKGSHTSFFPQTSKSYINKNILEHFGLFIFWYNCLDRNQIRRFRNRRSSVMEVILVLTHSD